MAIVTKSISFKTLALIVLGLAFSLGVIAVVYQGAQSTKDFRSRAAQESTIVKGWEFNGKTTDGWESQTNSLSVSNGALHFTLSPNTQQNSIMTTTSFTIPTGLRYVEMNMSVISPNILIMGRPSDDINARMFPRGYPTPQPAPPMQVEIHFQQRQNIGIMNKPDDQAPDTRTAVGGGFAIQKGQFADIPGSMVTVQVTPDGRSHDYSVAFANTLQVYRVDRVVMVFPVIATSAREARASVSINWIHVVEYKQTPTPVPNVSCSGPNGSVCSVTSCPVCAFGQLCSKMPCRIIQGSCYNGQCKTGQTSPQPSPAPVVTCTPQPTCAPGTKCMLPLYYPQGGWCPTPKPVVTGTTGCYTQCEPGKACVQMCQNPGSSQYFIPAQ